MKVRILKTEDDRGDTWYLPQYRGFLFWKNIPFKHSFKKGEKFWSIPLSLEAAQDLIKKFLLEKGEEKSDIDVPVVIEAYGHYITGFSP